MSQKRKRGLQRGLSEIVERQTAPVAEKSQLSRGLIDKFSEPKTTTMPSQTRRTSRTTSGSPTRQTKQQAIAPERDFHRTANSITREAIPSGLFKGQSKKLYDALYLLTRGAVTPTRSIRISRPRLMQKAAIGARVTFDAHVLHLQRVGLISVRQIPGEHEGNEYTVLLPEEISLSSLTTLTRQTSPAQNLVGLEGLENSQTRQSLSVAEQRTSNDPKTFSNTVKRIDDEAFAAFIELFQQITVELTGKSLTARDRSRLRELAELLTAELQIAAARTGQVSNVPAFLTEHLRRRLWKKDKAQLEREAQAAPAPRPGIDTSKCPDCGGSGWWYPDGVERGVAKCKHQSLPAK